MGPVLSEIEGSNRPVLILLVEVFNVDDTLWSIFA